MSKQLTFSNTAVVAKPDKLTALFFKYMWPLSFLDDLGNLSEKEIKIILGIMDESGLWPNYLGKGKYETKRNINIPARMFDKTLEIKAKNITKKLIKYNEIGNGLCTTNSSEIAILEAAMIFNAEAALEAAHLNKYGINAVPVFLNEEFSLPDNYSELIYSLISNKAKEKSVLEVNIINAPVIQSSKLEWEQIREIRNDPQAKKELQRFRLFVFDDYLGKPESYIHESIEQKIFKYSEMCIKHGIETKLSIIKQTLDSKSLLAMSSMAFVSALTGNTSIASMSLLAGAAIEVGKMSINLAERNISASWDKSQSEVAFLTRFIDN